MQSARQVPGTPTLFPPFRNNLEVRLLIYFWLLFFFWLPEAPYEQIPFIAAQADLVLAQVGRLLFLLEVTNLFSRGIWPVGLTPKCMPANSL